MEILEQALLHHSKMKRIKGLSAESGKICMAKTQFTG